jgi:hypothetical protein
MDVILKLLFQVLTWVGAMSFSWAICRMHLQDALLALEQLGGDTGFEFGGQVSSFSFHRSDFAGDLPLSDQLKFQLTSGSVLQDRFRSLWRPFTHWEVTNLTIDFSKIFFSHITLLE